MSGYWIAAIPTVYRGRRYHSRLEARWAAFLWVQAANVVQWRGVDATP